MDTHPDGARILGFEFVEYAAPDPAAFGGYLSRLGFTAVARHRSKDVVLYRQNGINIIVNSDVESFEQSYSHLRGVRICAIALRVRDAAAAYEQALRRGAWEVESQVRVMEVNIPGIAGAGETVTYFIDRFDHPSIYDIDFVTIPHDAPGAGASLTRIHSITYSVRDGRARDCADFGVAVLGLEEAVDDVRPARGGATTVVRTPDGSVRLVFAEPQPAGMSGVAADPLFESVQHVTFASSDIDATVRAFAARGVGVERVVTSGRALRIVTAPQPVAGDSRDTPTPAAQHAGTVYFDVVEEVHA
jgi:4-hydroxyphenylpyruvate dioxygenase